MSDVNKDDPNFQVCPRCNCWVARPLVYPPEPKAALTAAAEAECPECKKWENRYAFAKGIYEKELSEAKAALTAAAEVGGVCPTCGADGSKDRK